MENTFVVFAGPNGSGKSTVSKAFINEHPDIYYVCADNIAKHKYRDISDLEKRAALSMQDAEKAIQNAIADNAFCGYETVLSSDYKWPIFECAKHHGLKFISFFIATNNPEINLKRIAHRVSEGSHDVPPQKVIDRYYRSIDRLPRLLEYSDIGFVYDNSQENSNPALLLLKAGNSILCSSRAQKKNQWAQPCIAKLIENPDYMVVMKSERYMTTVDPKKL